MAHYVALDWRLSGGWRAAGGRQAAGGGSTDHDDWVRNGRGGSGGGRDRTEKTTRIDKSYIAIYRIDR